MKRMIRAVLSLALSALAILASGAAQADAIGKVIPPFSAPLTPNSVCGVDAVGILPDGRWYAGRLGDFGNTYDEKNNLRYGTAAVAADGRWFICQPWVKPGEPPTTPQPDNTPCGGGLGVTPTWTGADGTTCRGDRPFAGAFAGKTEVFRSAELGKYGNATFRCAPGGKMELQPGADCVRAPECSGTIAYSWGTGAACAGSISGFFPAGTTFVIPSSTPKTKGSAGAWCNPRTMALEVAGGANCVLTQ